MKRYRLYGLDLASEVPLTHAVPELPGTSGDPDLTFELIGPDGGSLPGEDDPEAREVYRSPKRRPDGAPVLTAVRSGGSITLLRYTGEAVLAVAERRIVARPEAPGEEGRGLAELRLLGPALAFWLERSGVPVLHASAVTVGGRGVALLAGGRGGKSSLAAALLDAGHPLLTDDVLAVDASAHARPSYPQMRLEPADAARRLGAERADGLPRAHPGFEKRRLAVDRFDPQVRPLARIYRLDRKPPGDAGPVTIEPLAARDALMALVAGSFLPRLSEAMGWGARRLDLLARLASAVPVRRIGLPDGLEHLPEVAERVAEDAASS